MSGGAAQPGSIPTTSWVDQNKRFRPEGARNTHAIRWKGSEPILAMPGGPFRAHTGGEFPRVNPGLCFLGRFGPRMGRMIGAKQIPVGV